MLSLATTIPPRTTIYHLTFLRSSYRETAGDAIDSHFLCHKSRGETFPYDVSQMLGRLHPHVLHPPQGAVLYRRPPPSFPVTLEAFLAQTHRQEDRVLVSKPIAAPEGIDRVVEISRHHRRGALSLLERRQQTRRRGEAIA